LPGTRSDGKETRYAGHTPTSQGGTPRQSAGQ